MAGTRTRPVQEPRRDAVLARDALDGRGADACANLAFGGEHEPGAVQPCESPDAPPDALTSNVFIAAVREIASNRSLRVSMSTDLPLAPVPWNTAKTCSLAWPVTP